MTVSWYQLRSWIPKWRKFKFALHSWGYFGVSNMAKGLPHSTADLQAQIDVLKAEIEAIKASQAATV